MGELYLQYESDSSAGGYYFSILDQTNANILGNSFKQTKFEKLLSVRGVAFKPIISSHFYPKIRTYMQRNVLQYNLPYICYKFPLSEHTTEG